MGAGRPLRKRVRSAIARTSGRHRGGEVLPYRTTLTFGARRRDPRCAGALLRRFVVEVAGPVELRAVTAHLLLMVRLAPRPDVQAQSLYGPTMPSCDVNP